MEAFHVFTLAGIPVRVTLGFILLIGYYAFSLRGGGIAAIAGWLIAVVVSFLVHEFGHALVARRYRLKPQVYLHGWGGLCAHEQAEHDRHDAYIIVAGPLAGLALAGIVWLVHAAYPARFVESDLLFELHRSMWFINFYWSLVNLLPLYPLDGGQLFRLGMVRWVKPRKRAELIVHGVSIAIAAVGLVYAIMTRSLLVGILSVMLGLQNVRLLQTGSPDRVRARSALVDQLLRDAVGAFEAGDPREARRLAYQARDERNVATDQVQHAFELLAVTSIALEDWAEALDWAKRANATPAVDEAKVLALIGLGRIAEARHALAESKLGGEARARIETRLG